MKRLKQIKKMYGLIEANEFVIKTFDYDYLFKQAEKVEELQNENKKLNQIIRKCEGTNK